MVSVAFAGHVAHPVSYAQVKTVVEPSYTVVETPTVEHVGSVVKSFPSATSYQSQTQYHSKSVVEPIYAHGVEKSVISTPIVKKVVEHVKVAAPVVQYAHVEPYVHHEPAVKYISAPVAYAHSAPAHYEHSLYAPKALSYVAAPAHYAHSAYSAYPYSHYHH